MKILFISLRDVNKKNSGGEKCTNRNFKSLQQIAGQDQVCVINITAIQDKGFFTRVFKLRDFLCGYYGGLTRAITRSIVQQAMEFDYVFIDVSYLGLVAHQLRKSGYKGKIISFFHNVEYLVIRQKAKIRPLNFWKILSVLYNEKKAILNSDVIIALNLRDKKILKKRYHAGSIEVIPISLEDELEKPSDEMTNRPPTLLFIGDNWYANIHGLRWFIRNVLDQVNVKLVIAGRNLDHYKDLLDHPKIEFLGFVNDLSKVLKDTDYYISPVFIGGGMKVKICEALMYGKNIIGTTEAFQGYDIEISAIGALCNTKEEFIMTLNSYCMEKRPRFNERSRNYFIRWYSFDATLESFRKLFAQS